MCYNDNTGYNSNIASCCRSHFEAAEKDWVELGEASDLHVIIIDEIDAICKPRGVYATDWIGQYISTPSQYMR